MIGGFAGVIRKAGGGDQAGDQDGTMQLAAGECKWEGNCEGSGWEIQVGSDRVGDKECGQ